MKTQIEVFILLGNKNLHFSIECLSSFVNYVQNEISLYILNDGSLTVEDKKNIKKRLFDVEIISKQVADEHMNKLLKEYPLCKKLRDNFVLFKKYVDSFYFASNSNPTLILDSDILFFRPFKLDNLPSAPTSVFIEAEKSGYSLYPWNLFPFSKIKLNQKMNSGLVYTNSTNLFLEEIESFLSNKKFHTAFKKKRWYVEQTIFALTGSMFKRSYLFNKNQIYNARKVMKVNTSEIVGIHFIGTYRSQHKQFKDLNFSKQEVTLSFRRAKKLNPFNFFFESFILKIKNWFN